MIFITLTLKLFGEEINNAGYTLSFESKNFGEFF